MRKPVRLCTIALVVVLLATTPFSTSCTCLMPSPVPYGPKVTGDGTGGAIAVYEDIRSGNQHDFYAQKIDTDGRTMWPDDGILFTDHGTHALAYDGHGGAVIAWGSGKSMFKSERSYVQRIDSEGKLLWGEEGIRLNP